MLLKQSKLYIKWDRSISWFLHSAY